MQIVVPARFLDGIVFALFMLFVSGGGLLVFGEFHRMCVQDSAEQAGFVSVAMDALFSFPQKKYAFTLTHILLFAILISLLSMTHHPAQEIVRDEAEKKVKEAAKKEKPGKGE
eukprot:TRINITY_DN59054_c0_g1_i1.p1 TRINITY_DN59054_c0_g1~~TRINITY_DN59054_c0_g1_i1.p1  ORF type:complete len:113 (+),score=33.37 TRINITY_DN59054_c0_g1_i1:82-420(+)